MSEDERVVCEVSKKISDELRAYDMNVAVTVLSNLLCLGLQYCGETKPNFLEKISSTWDFCKEN